MLQVCVCEQPLSNVAQIPILVGRNKLKKHVFTSLLESPVEISAAVQAHHIKLYIKCTHQTSTCNLIYRNLQQWHICS